MSTPWSTPNDLAKVDREEYTRIMADKPVQLSSGDAIVEQEQDRAVNASAKVWDSLRTFYRAPCLQPSLGIGAAGGFGIGALRYLGGAGGMPAFTWASTVVTSPSGAAVRISATLLIASGRGSSGKIVVIR